MNWQVITIEQAIQLEKLGILETSNQSWVKDFGTDKHELVEWNDFENGYFHNAYNLSEIAVMLGYTFVKSNVKEAADQLIQEIQVGSSTAKDCNARLQEAKSQSF